MKKVLIITYYWPPSGGSGVQRWLKCVRYLRDYGWEPIVFTVENGEYPVLDESLEKEVPEGVQVIRRPIWEPYQLYKRFTGQKPKKRVVSGFIKDKKPSFTKRVSMWIRGNMFIPDARKFWIKPASRYLKSWLKENPVDVIVSTGPPHSMHLIAHRVTRKLNIPWLADFRDPWTGIPYYKDLKLTGWADRKHHRQEKMITVDADRFVVVGNHMKKEFEAIGGREVDVITNGYDEADLRPQLKSARDKDFTIVHIGFLAETQNHESLWQALGELAGEDDVFREKLRIRMIGKTDIGVEMYMKEYGIHDRAEFIDYVPHTEAIENQGRAQVLLLTINNVENAKEVLKDFSRDYR
ncbi:MAG: glycosyltransferase, partial [Bacteroidota bacterium]